MIKRKVPEESAGRGRTIFDACVYRFRSYLRLGQAQQHLQYFVPLAFVVVAVCKSNPNVLMILYFLHKLVDVLSEYFDGLEDESIRDNFVVTYELLDEMMDNGYPQITEDKVLREYIKTESNKLAKSDKISEAQVPVAASNIVSWRPEGIKYGKNEIFLDVVEKLNLLVLFFCLIKK